MGLYSITLFLAILVPRLCTGKTDSTLCSTCSVAPTCTRCNINADVLTTSSTYLQFGNPTIGTPIWDAFLVFTAYSVTTESSISGDCVTYTQSPINGIDAYQVQVQGLTTTVLTYLEDNGDTSSSVSYEGYTFFLENAYSSFYAAVGWEGCTASIPPSQSVPTYLGREAAVSATVAPSATAAGSSSTARSTGDLTESSTPGHRIHSKQIIILSVILPIVAIILLLLCFVIIRRYRKERSPAATTIYPKTASNTQLYVDQKAELEDDERRTHELEAGSKMHEMDGQDTVFEMPVDSKSRMELASPHKIQELRGLDPFQELEVPSNV